MPEYCTVSRMLQKLIRCATPWLKIENEAQKALKSVKLLLLN